MASGAVEIKKRERQGGDRPATALPTGRPPLDSARLAAFATVARERGFSRAARALGKTQSSVSQAVAQLEADLGERLFHRQGRGAVLTDAGRLLLGHVETIFGEMDRARAHLEATRTLVTGELIIGTSDTLACYLLPPVLAKFRKRFPGVELRLDNRPSPATALAVAERRVHLGVVSLPLIAPSSTDSRIVSEPLVPQEDRLICRPDHALARQRHLTLAHLAAVPLLLLDRSTAGRAFLDEALSRAGVRPRVAMEMSSVEVLKRLCELGFGVSVVPSWAAAREAAAGWLVRRPIADLAVDEASRLGGRCVGLITPASTPLSRASSAFVELIRRELPRAAAAATSGRSLSS